MAGGALTTEIAAINLFTVDSPATRQPIHATAKDHEKERPVSLLSRPTGGPDGLQITIDDSLNTLQSV